MASSKKEMFKTKRATSKIQWRPTTLNLITKEDHQAGTNTNSYHLYFTNLEMQEDHIESGGDKGNKDQRMGDTPNQEIK